MENGEDSDGGPALEFWCYGTGGADNPTGVFWQETARRFEKANPGVRVKVVADIPHGPYDSLLTTRFVAGKAPDVGLKLRRTLPNATLEIIDSCGHMPHEEQPEATLELIEDFLDG